MFSQLSSSSTASSLNKIINDLIHLSVKYYSNTRDHFSNSYSSKNQSSLRLPPPLLWPCLIVCCRDSEEEKVARCCQLPWLCRIIKLSCPNWCNLRHAQAPDRPDNSFYWRRNLFHARILQKCPQECKIRLYHLIGCYQWPFPSAWCFNRTVLTSRPRMWWYIFQSTDDKNWWR